MAINFLSLGKIQTSGPGISKSPNKINVKRPTSRHIIIKLSKVNEKERMLKKQNLKKKVTYKETRITLSADFSAHTLKAGSLWHDILKVWKEKTCQQ